MAWEASDKWHVGLMVGIIVGSLLGFIDTYGYAVTGYTTSELAPIISAILTLALLTVVLRRAPTVIEHLISIVTATGISLSTAITSGMYITYTMLNYMGGEGLDLPKWLYFRGGLIDGATITFYLYATAVSVSGVFLAYVFYKHFIEKERLPYPIGLAYSMIVSMGRYLSKPHVILPITLGILLQLLTFQIGYMGIDITSHLQQVLPGSSIALTLDFFIFFLALLIPLNTSIGIGIGNLIMYLILTPLLTYLGLMYVAPFMSSSDMVLEAAPYTASIMVGFLIITMTYYFISMRTTFALTLKLMLKDRTLLKRTSLSLALLISLIIPLYMLVKPSINLLTFLPLYFILHIVLALLTIRVVGETGTASQSTLPLATFTLFSLKIRNALTYVLLDPYTGVPMPQFMAGASMNIFKGVRKLGLDVDIVLPVLALSILIGAPLTLIYGHYLLLAYGLNSPKLNLLRWVPVVTWMNIIYRGDATAFNTTSIIIGALLALALIILLRVTRLGGISIYSILLGLTLTPDIGIIFLVASLIKYVALRIGFDVYESLLTYSSLMLAGCGIGIVVSTMMSLMGVM